MPFAVSALQIAPLKGAALLSVGTVDVGPRGLEGDRRFSILDGEGGLVTARNAGALLGVRPAVRDGVLTLTFPSGEEVTGAVVLGDAASGSYYGERRGRIVEGPFAQALERYLGRPARLMAHDEDSAGWDQDAVSIVSRASLRELARHAGRDEVDARRFRMSIELDGPGAHEEDGWIGRRLSVGGAVLEVTGPCERCMITTRDPDTGEVDLNVLRTLAGYRGKHTVFMGVLCRVVQPGAVRVGNELVVDEAR
jgi:uncharacterized protein YcbX